MVETGTTESPIETSAGSPLARNAGVPARRIRAALLSTGLAIATLLSGITVIAVSIEPNSDYISTEPWVCVLGPDRIGIEFVTYGHDFSAVLYGVVDSRGNWIVGPSPVTPRYGYFLSPSGAIAVCDSAARVHIAWILSGSNPREQSFYYLQLDGVGRVIATAGPLGNRSVTDQSYYPVSPGIQVNSSTVDVAWMDNGTSWAATLDLDGRLIQPAHPLAGNISGPPRVPSPLPSAFGSSASVGSDGAGFTYYVWQIFRFRQAGRQSLLEYEVGFGRTGPGGQVDRIVYSTDDFWWTTKPMVVPGFVFALIGAVTTPILAAYLARLRRLHGRP